MKRTLSAPFALLIALCLLVGSERRAFAYVDPGSGLIALQTAASVVAAYAYFLRRRIRTFFTRRQNAAHVVELAPAPARAVQSADTSRVA
jgi:hypothetical protein